MMMNSKRALIIITVILLVFSKKLSAIILWDVRCEAGQIQLHAAVVSKGGTRIQYNFGQITGTLRQIIDGLNELLILPTENVYVPPHGTPNCIFSQDEYLWLEFTFRSGGNIQTVHIALNCRLLFAGRNSRSNMPITINLTSLPYPCITYNIQSWAASRLKKLHIKSISRGGCFCTPISNLTSMDTVYNWDSYFRANEQNLPVAAGGILQRSMLSFNNIGWTELLMSNTEGAVGNTIYWGFITAIRHNISPSQAMGNLSQSSAYHANFISASGATSSSYGGQHMLSANQCVSTDVIDALNIDAPHHRCSAPSEFRSNCHLARENRTPPQAVANYSQHHVHNSNFISADSGATSSSYSGQHTSQINQTFSSSLSADPCFSPSIANILNIDRPWLESQSLAPQPQIHVLPNNFRTPPGLPAPPNLYIIRRLHIWLLFH